MRTLTPAALVERAVSFLARQHSTLDRADTASRTLAAWTEDNREQAEFLEWPELLETLVDVGDDAGLWTVETRANLDKRVESARRFRDRQAVA
jgi:tryptophan 2,3-dioxygenase